MGKLRGISFLGLMVLFSCDYVKNPYPEGNLNLSDTANCPQPVFATVTNHVKKILIEDFTGHTCGNCPKAAKELHQIDSIYSGQIIGIAIHVGGYAIPNPGYNGSDQTAFLNDYRTSVGEQYDATFGASNFGLPQGMFNRKDYDAVNQTHLKFYPNWKNYAASIVAEPSVVDLQIAVDYNQSNRKLCLAIKDSFLTTVTGNYKLVIAITQDSIISWQDNIGVNKADYVHRHVLRDVITPSGAFGETLITGTAAAGTKHIKRFAYIIPTNYNNVICDANKCHLVAYIFNADTYEIIQAEEVKLIQ
ncbi:MAG: Omp28-related outer membrane protein [Bacteroidia bacterium]